MTPTGSETGARNSWLEMRLLLWADQQWQWELFGSSTGFSLPDDSVLSPGASLVRLDRWQALTPEQRRGFPLVSPDLVVELASSSDEGPRGLTTLRSKMAAYQANGTRLGWLLILHEQAGEVWPASADPQRFEGIAMLVASPEFPALQLQLDEIWAV
jgi:Uma2 family endonuclease